MDGDINDWLLVQANLLQRPVCVQPFNPPANAETFIIAIYDPFEQVTIEADLIYQLNQMGWMQELTNRLPIRDIKFFENPWIATKILRIMFTGNFYCFRNSNEVTSGIGLLFSIEEAIQVQNHLKKFGLSSVIYSERKIEGWKRVHIAKEPWNYKDSMTKPNHLKIWKSNLKSTYSKFPRFTQFYYKMERVQTKIRQEPNTVKQLISRIQWSWMCFLLPIAQDENSISVLELTKYLVDEVDEMIGAKSSLKLILNCLKCHPIQIAGTTNIVCFSHKISGNEMCFAFFKYVYDNSITQWITQDQLNADVEELTNQEILKSWTYENDWCWLNEYQTNLMETFIYAEEWLNFPNDMPKIWKKNRERIQRRTTYDRGKNPNKATLVPLMLQLLQWLR